MAMTNKQEDDLILTAFRHAEQDVEGLCHAYENMPKERKPWERLLKRLRDYRKKRWPDRVSLRDHVESVSTPTPIHKITGGPNREFKSPG